MILMKAVGLATCLDCVGTGLTHMKSLHRIKCTHT